MLGASAIFETYGTGRLEEAEIARRVQASFDFRMGPIIERLRLRELTERDGGFLRELSAYGHFGRRDLALPWQEDVALEQLR